MNYFFGKDLDTVKKYSDDGKIIEENLEPILNQINAEILAYYLYKFGPILAVVKGRIGYHSLVIKGILNNEIIIHDPWYGPNLIYSFDDFKKIFTGSILFYKDGYSNKLINELAESESSNVDNISNSNTNNTPTSKINF